MSDADAPARPAADRILYLLKTGGARTARELATALEMSPMGARQHLQKLARQELVRAFSRAEQVGRPRQYWELTEAARGRFPDRHEELTVQLIDSVREVFGDAGLDQLIARREADTEARYRAALAGRRTLAQRLERLAQLRSEEGYMAQVIRQGPDDYLLVENHCPICAAATRCQGFCRSELELFRRCLEARVSRCEYLLDGARRCAYRVQAD